MNVAPYDLVLADPPYEQHAAEGFLEWVSIPGLVSATGRVIIEREAGGPAASGERSRFRLVRTARYGRTALDFYTLSNRCEPRPA